MMVAGEASGDLHGGRLITELKRLSPELEIFGIGGDQMRQAGMELLYHVDDMAVVGFTEVLGKIPFFKRVMNDLIHGIKVRNPDLIILIDYPGFNIRFAKQVCPSGIKIMYYIAPQVWAWAAHRKKQLAKVIHQMVVILPFEKSLWQQAGIPTEFVGHPLLDIVHVEGKKEQFFAQNKLESNQKLVGLLPGSRVHEVKRHLPEMIRTVILLRKKGNLLNAVVAKAPTVPFRVYEKILRQHPFIRLVESQTYSIMKFSDLLVVASGTATLESAYFLTPLIVVYRVSRISFLIARRLVNLHNVSLVNVVAGKKIVPEFLQNNFRARFLASAMQDLLYNSNLRTEMIENLRQVKTLLGAPGASLQTAKIALNMVNQPSPERTLSLPVTQKSSSKGYMRLTEKLKMKFMAQLGCLLILFLGKLSTIKIVGRQHWEQLQRTGTPYIICPWHGRMLLPIYVHRNQGIHALVSLHSDGEMLAQSLQKLGYNTVRGSSTRGGLEAFYKMVSVLKNREVGAIIPDGPKGPPQILKSGILRIAQQTGAYILPMTFSSSKKIQFNSWDKFTLTLPLSESIVIYGKPIAIPQKISNSQFEELRCSLEKDMIRLQKEADDYFRK